MAVRTEQLDAVVIGANIRGLVTAYVLGALGQKTVLLDKAKAIGGVDGSFVTPGGHTFDHGLHVLDYMRSGAATRLFSHVTEGRVKRTTLARAIVLRGHVMPYAPPPAEMPAALRELLPSDDLVDDLGSEPPTRERLSAVYGRPFTDMIFDEVLPSYRCEARHLEFGVDESRLLTNIYPWFFPRARRQKVAGDESRAFHDLLRSGVPQDVLYPLEGGFQGFSEGFVRHLDPRAVELVMDAGDVHVELEPGSHSARWVEASGRRFEASHYFFAGGWPRLCQLLDIPCQNPATDRMVLGSFVLSRPATSDFHEILVGDPDHPINRIYFPSSFRPGDEPLVQIEFTFPEAEDGSLEADGWRDRWIDSMGRLGLIDASHRVEEYDFRTFVIHMNSFGMEGEALVDADPSLLRDDANIVPVVPSMANLNLNSHVPRTIRQVITRVSPDPLG